MKIIKNIFRLVVATMASIALTSCIGDLDQFPHIEKTGDDIYSEAGNYKHVLAKLYASFVIAGQEKGGGNADITGSNTGEDYMRCYINVQELGTDEVAYSWPGGDNLYDISHLSWNDRDDWVTDMYYHIYYSIAICNEFIRNSTDEAIAKFTVAEQDEIKEYRREARFLRAWAYSHAMDLYGDVPYIDETHSQDYLPVQYTRKEIFDYITSELEAIAVDLPSRTEVQYGRVGSAAAYALLAKIYLNAEVYAGEDHYDDCVLSCKEVISQGYTLEEDYHKLFNGDNHLRTNEIIHLLPVDAKKTMAWGSTTYLVCGSMVDQNLEDFGVEANWNSFRAKEALFNKFEDGDGRGEFEDGPDGNLVTSLGDINTGARFTKWSNITDAGEAASSTKADGGVNTDFVVSRLADVYLMYAEAVLRGSTEGTEAEALGYVNELRQRAYGDATGIITAGELDLDFILDERARELYLECVRRTDLVRFEKFTSGDELWEFKGGIAGGRAVDDRFNVYPKPYSELSANPNVTNAGY